MSHFGRFIGTARGWLSEWQQGGIPQRQIGTGGPDCKTRSNSWLLDIGQVVQPPDGKSRWEVTFVQQR
jgi:hypothetical protein